MRSRASGSVTVASTTAATASSAPAASAATVRDTPAASTPGFNTPSAHANTGMLSLGQKLIAVGSLAFLEVLAFLFFWPVGVVGLLFAVPLAVLVLKR